MNEFVSECSQLKSDDIIVLSNDKWMTFDNSINYLINSLTKRQRVKLHIKAICTNKNIKISESNHQEQVLRSIILRSHPDILKFCIKAKIIQNDQLFVALEHSLTYSMFEHALNIIKSSPNFKHYEITMYSELTKLLDMYIEDQDIPISIFGNFYLNRKLFYYPQNVDICRKIILHKRFTPQVNTNIFIPIMYLKRIPDEIIKLFIQHHNCSNLYLIKDLSAEYNRYHLWFLSLFYSHTNKEYLTSLTIIFGNKDSLSILSLLPTELISIIINYIQY
jgi:hypothetical protein